MKQDTARRRDIGNRRNGAQPSSAVIEVDASLQDELQTPPAATSKRRDVARSSSAAVREVSP
jgi:hypothetical protein